MTSLRDRIAKLKTTEAEQAITRRVVVPFEDVETRNSELRADPTREHAHAMILTAPLDEHEWEKRAQAFFAAHPGPTNDAARVAAAVISKAQRG